MTETSTTTTAKAPGCLTRAEAVQHLTVTQQCTRGEALLDNALALYPGCARTNYLLITGYKAGSIFGPWSPGCPGIPEALFAICRW